MKKVVSLILMFLFLICCHNIKESSSVYFINVDHVENNQTQKSTNLKNPSHWPKSTIPKVPTVVIDSVKYNLVEGDLLMTDYEWIQYQIQRSRSYQDSTSIEKLVVERINNKIIKWDDDHILKYSISRNTFRSRHEYEMVKSNLKSAIEEWEATCNVRFYHDEAKDNLNIIQPTSDLTFVVLGFDAKGEFIASAFFPYYSIERRRVLVDPTYFTTKYDKVGVFRHELGHVLGFRHEHIREEAPLDCQGESRSGTVNETVYDSKSVMHYFCGGMGTINLSISDIDREGSQSIYGKPKH